MYVSVFDGMYWGDVKQFDSKWDRVGVFDLIQFQNNTLPTFERLALYNPITQDFDAYPSAKPAIWAGGAATIARDGITLTT
jgi:hypothetical protein